MEAQPPPVLRPPVLVVGTDEWAIEQAVGVLADAGIPALRCQELGEPAFPCNAFVAERSCPVEVGCSGVLTVRSRPLPDAAPRETGVVCALRAGLPLVVAGMTQDSPFAGHEAASVARDADLAAACAVVLGAAPVAAAPQVKA